MESSHVHLTSQCFVACCVGNIIGPQVFFADEAPSYPSGFAAILPACEYRPDHYRAGVSYVGKYSVQREVGRGTRTDRQH